MYGGGRQYSNGGCSNSGGRLLSASWSEATRLPGRGTMTSTAEAATGLYDILSASKSCCIVVGSAVDSSHAV